jgi:hypothetical protein
MVNHPANLMVASWGIGLLALRHGDLPRALPLLEQAVGICHEADLLVYFPWIATAGCSLYPGRARRRRRAATHAGDGTVSGNGKRLHAGQVPCRLSLGQAHLLAGRLEGGTCPRRARPGARREHHERGNGRMRCTSLVTLRHGAGGSQQAAAHYREALALAELGMRPLVAHCHLGLGTLCATTGQREQTRAACLPPWRCTCYGDDFLAAQAEAAGARWRAMMNYDAVWWRRFPSSGGRPTSNLWGIAEAPGRRNLSLSISLNAGYVCP